MKSIKYNKLILTLMAVGGLICGVLVFNLEKTEPLEFDSERKDPSVVAEKMESSEISQDSKINATIEEIKGNFDLFKFIRNEDGEIRPAPPSSVTVIENAPLQPPVRVQYLSDEMAAELELSHHQVIEFQKIINYYRQRLDRHITDNSTVEVLGDKHHKIKVPILEDGFEIREAASQELQLLLGRDKYDNFSKLDDGKLDKFFDLYGEYPRTIEVRVIEGGPFGGDLKEFKITTQNMNINGYAGNWTRHSRLHSKQYNKHKVYTDLVASYDLLVRGVVDNVSGD